MKKEIEEILAKIAQKMGLSGDNINVEYPENLSYGDLSTNIAMVNAKKTCLSPMELAEKIMGELKPVLPQYIAEVTFIKPGFINFRVKDEYFAKKVSEGFSISKRKSDKEIMIEYTDPNTFKAFHVGHFMSNSIGESLSRLIEFSGAKVVRICYPSDIGLHIAKSVWAWKKNISDMPKEDAPISERTTFLGKMYVEGTKAYESDEKAKKEIDDLNGILYEKSDKAIDDLYMKGRKWSLDDFDRLYKILGTKFDETIFESEMAMKGLDMVRANIGKIFSESEGAIVFKGEEYGLHTRVFVNSKGIPTYEAKDLGLNVTKFSRHPGASESIIITANEQNDYFKVLKEVFLLLDEKSGQKTKHIGHGMLRFSHGKMSSRTGNVVTADALINDIKDLVAKKIEGRGYGLDEIDEIAKDIAVGAIKYTILRQSIGGDVIFDSASSISFEGDSGPYLQYSVVRARSIIEKAGSIASGEIVLPQKVGELERLIYRFEDVAMRACENNSPAQVASYLISLAGAFNTFYNAQIILDEKNPLSPYFVKVTESFFKVMDQGFWILGIKVPKKM